MPSGLFIQFPLVFLIVICPVSNMFEKNNLLEKQKEGIAIAVREGKYKGRKSIYINSFEQEYALYKERVLTKTALAKKLGVSRPTLDRMIKEYENNIQ